MFMRMIDRESTYIFPKEFAMYFCDDGISSLLQFCHKVITLMEEEAFVYLSTHRTKVTTARSLTRRLHPSRFPPKERVVVC